jgi:CDP-diacylglycerol--glycerol-3-phosphate 3-phosphatidyltransferase
MAVVIASAELNDDEFLAALATCTLPLSSFRHGDHLRFAWIQLHRQSFDDALAAVRNGIRKYATHHGVAHIFHETLTTAWVKLLATHHEDSFSEFIRINEARLNRELLYRFWTPSALDSESARSGWLPPDREPIPGLKYH